MKKGAERAWRKGKCTLYVSGICGSKEETSTRGKAHKKGKGLGWENLVSCDKRRIARLSKLLLHYIYEANNNG